MEYQVKDNTGTSFRNENKQSDKHAEFNGSGMIDGVEYWINTWVNVSQNGKKYFKHTFKKKDAKQSAPAAKGSQGSGFDDIPDDLPF